MISKSSAAISVEKSSSSGKPSKSAFSHATSSSSSSTLSTFDEKKEKRTATIEKSTTPTSLSSSSSLSSSCLSKTHPSSSSSSSNSSSTTNPPNPVPPVPPQRYKAQKGDIITLSLDLTPENDYIPEPLFDTTGIVTFALGWGNYLPAVHSLLLDRRMSAGDCISGISIDAGWGERNPDLVARIPRAAAEKFKLNYGSVRAGMELTLDRLDGNMRVAVTEVTDSYFEVDANPPLAGASYECNFAVLNVERPTLCWEYHGDDDDDDDGATPSVDKSREDEHDENDSDENNVHLKCDEACFCCHDDAGDTTTTTTTASISAEKACSVNHAPKNTTTDNNNNNDNTKTENKYQVASFALGCFWGAELAFMRIPGVVGTKVGYTQGTISNPTYDEVCTGLTKHTEAVLMVYDSAVVTYEQLVRVALDRIKETTAVGTGYHRINTVGGRGIHDDDDDRNTQYRHGIYYHTNEQKEVACEMLRHMGGDYGGICHINVEVRRATVFYNAEDYHQQYLLKGGQSAKKGCTETIRCFG